MHGATSGDDWEGHPWLLLHYRLGDGRFVVLSAFKGMKLVREKLPLDARHYALTSGDLGAWRARLTKEKTEFREEDHGAQASIYFEAPEGTV